MVILATKDPQNLCTYDYGECHVRKQINNNNILSPSSIVCGPIDLSWYWKPCSIQYNVILLFYPVTLLDIVWFSEFRLADLFLIYQPATN